MGDSALDFQEVSKEFDGLQAVDTVSLSIPSGQMYGLLGPNGAGKTTLMRMAMDILAPDSGTILLYGKPYRAASRSLFGYLPEERGLYPRMKLLSHLQFLGEIRGLSARDARERSLRWLERFQLADRAERRIRDLSKGLQQKVQFIGTILHEPSLLILDEPFSGLDPVNTRFLKDVLLELKQSGTTIILSTHLMEQAEKLCDAICLINHGRIVLSGRIGEVRQRYGRNSVIVEYRGNGAAISELPIVRSTNDYGNYVEVHLHDGVPPESLFAALGSLELQVRRFEAAESSLNEIFIQAVGNAGDS